MNFLLHLRKIGIFTGIGIALAVSCVFVRSPKDIWIFPAALAAAYALLFLLPWLFLAAISLAYPMKKQYDKPSRFCTALFNFGYGLIIAAGNVRVHVRGLEQVPEEPFLFVCNHRSKFDNMIASAVLRKHPMAFVSKPSNFKIPIGRHYMVRGLYLSIDRNDVAQSYNTMVRAAALPEKGLSVGIYPEGTRSKTTEMGEFHDGCFIIAKKAKVPVVVATVTGTQNIHLRGPWRRTDVYFDIAGILPAEKVCAERTGALAAEAKELMQQNLNKRKEENHL